MYVQNLRFADNTAIIEETEYELDDTLTKMSNSFKEYNINVNENKTKILETVKRFAYLVSKIINDRKNKNDNRRSGM